MLRIHLAACDGVDNALNNMITCRNNAKTPSLKREVSAQERLNGGMPYFIEGTLVDAETGNPILNTNGQTITASTEFYGGMYQLRAIKEPQAVINEFYGYLDRLQKHYDENGIDIELIYHPIKENDPHERDIKKFLGDMRGWIEKNVATNGRGEFIGVVSTDMRGDGEEEAGLFSVSVDAIIEAVISTLPENERAEFEHMFKIPFAEALRLQYLRSLDISDSSIARAKDKLTELKNATPQVFAETLPPINGSNFDVRTAESALIAYLDAKITQSSYPLDDYIDYTDLWEFLHAGEWYDELKASPTYMNIKARAVDYLKAVDVLDAKNVAVPFTVDITATSYDNKTLAANGQAVLQINLPSEIVKGKRVSVATRIKTVATNNTEYKWLEERVTTFKEIKQAPADPQRAVFYPAASSYVHSFIDGHPHAASIDDDNMTRFADTVSFTNLLPGKKYEVCGTVVDKNSGAPLKDATNGMPIVKMFEFTADNATGTIDVPFEFDARATGIDKSTSGADAVSDVVVFEEIRLIGNAENGVTDKKLVAEHKDINDENARISIDANLEDSQTPLAETGDQASHAMAIGGIALAILSICFVMRRRNGHSI